MTKGSKSHLLFFLILLMPVQLILLPIGFLADYLVVSWNRTDHLERPGFRTPHSASSGNYRRIMEGGNDPRPGLPWEPHAPRDSNTLCLAGNHLRRYLPSTVQNLDANPALKATMSTSITPLVLLSQFLVTSTLTDKIVYLLFVVCYSLCNFSWLTKKHPDI